MAKSYYTIGRHTHYLFATKVLNNIQPIMIFRQNVNANDVNKMKLGV